MTDSIQSLEHRRKQPVRQNRRIGRLSSRSVTAIRKKCGKANCCCLEEQHPGHGPHWRLTYKIKGKPIRRV